MPRIPLINSTPLATSSILVLTLSILVVSIFLAELSVDTVDFFAEVSVYRKESSIKTEHSQQDDTHDHLNNVKPFFYFLHFPVY